MSSGKFINLQTFHDKLRRITHIILICLAAATATGGMLHAMTGERPDPAILTACQQAAQRQGPQRQSPADLYMQFRVEGQDTVYIAELPPARVYSKLPRQKGREWRKYYRLVHNFSKTYPYALAARHLVHEVDSTIAADNLKRGKRDKYINAKQKELFDDFEQPMRHLTVSQGALLMKLIDREIGKSSYFIIKDYKNGMAAGFWQGIAKLFGTDLKKPYEPEGEDRPIEELVELWETGQFEGLYFSLFWKYPPNIEIPSKYK